MKIIVACDDDNGIGLNNTIPWNVKEDLLFFRQKTLSTIDPYKQNAVIMGHNTWKSLNYTPLKFRLNIILTSNKTYKDTKNIKFINDFDDYKKFEDQVETIYCIGGGIIYSQALQSCTDIFLTKIHGSHGCDTHFPQINNFIVHSEKKSKECTYIHYKKSDEDQYINLVNKILTYGKQKDDRTGTGTISLFGEKMEFSLETFPLLTSKHVSFKNVAEELLWFVGGKTNSHLLKDKKVNIWNSNATREFLDSRGLTNNKEGDLGPVYGFQWRHFGEQYVDCDTKYTGGIDQLKNVIATIKKNPDDRRIIMTAWNPSDIDKMALPPCHLLCQFYVNGKDLSCILYQRSADVGLGVPYNIASYSLLTYMIAHICNLKPHKFIHFMGDTHIYSNHVGALKEQISNQLYHFPTLKIKRNVTDIDDFVFEDFDLIDYNSNKIVKMKMAV